MPRLRHLAATLLALAACGAPPQPPSTPPPPIPSAAPTALPTVTLPPATAPTPSAAAVPVEPAPASAGPSATAASARRPPAGSVPLAGKRVRFQLPNGRWHANPVVDKVSSKMWGFERDFIPDADGRSVVPFMGIIVEGLDAPMDAVTFSFQKRVQAPFLVDRVFIWQDEPRLALKNAIGYEGHVAYPDGLRHDLVVIHAVEGKQGISIVCDSTESVYATAAPEFFDFVASLAIE